MDIGKQIDRSGLKVVGICNALLGGIFLVQLPYMYKSEVDFRSKAIRATGTVVETRKEMKPITSGGFPTTTTEYISTVRFQTNQAESVEFTTSSTSSIRRDGKNKEIPVLYDPNRPKAAIIDSGTTPEYRFKGLLLFSVVLLLGGIALTVLVPTDSNQWNKNLH
jgi:hypothetical protein